MVKQSYKNKIDNIKLSKKMEANEKKEKVQAKKKIILKDLQQLSEKIKQIRKKALKNRKKEKMETKSLLILKKPRKMLKKQKIWINKKQRV